MNGIGYSRTAAWILALALPLAPLAARAGEGEREKREQAERKEREGKDKDSARKPTQEELLYALGAILGQKLAAYAFKPAELAPIQRGFGDAAARRKLHLADPDLEGWGGKVDEMLGRRITPAIAAARDKGSAFADGVAKEPGAVRLPSGLVLRTLQPGTGKGAAPTSKVTVSYTGKLIDGTVFDSSATHGGPATFALNQVIPCWTEGVSHMKQGEKAQLVCPSNIAYGNQGRPPQIPGGATLVFEIELLKVE